MFGLVFILIGTFFEETTSTIGKYEMKHHLERPFGMGFLNSVALLGIVLSTVVIRWDVLHFSVASIPTLAIRMVFEVIQGVSAVLAVKYAERSTFSFLRTMTIPLILIVDLMLGYVIQPVQIVGMLVIAAALLLLFMNHGIKKAGVWFVVANAVNAVVTTSLYKYNVTHFNSPEFEGLVSAVWYCGMFYILSHVYEKRHPFHLFTNRTLMAQSLSSGFAQFIEGYAYVFAPASVVMATKRSLNIVWSMLFGNKVFHEKHMIVKALTAAGCIVGIVMLTLAK